LQSLQSFDRDVLRSIMPGLSQSPSFPVEHVRVRHLVPVPHVLEHPDHPFQLVHTGNLGLVGRVGCGGRVGLGRGLGVGLGRLLIDDVKLLTAAISAEKNPLSGSVELVKF